MCTIIFSCTLLLLSLSTDVMRQDPSKPSAPPATATTQTPTPATSQVPPPNSTQTATPAKPRAPATPGAELVRSAAAANRLVYPEATPWHLKASYELLDINGHKVEKGTYEVFYAGPKKYKQSFESKPFTQTNYMTDKGMVRTGEMLSAYGPERVVANKIPPRFPSDNALRETNQQLFTQTVGGASLRCVALDKKGPTPAGVRQISTMYCFEPNQPTLRFERGTGTLGSEALGSTTFNDIVAFHDHFVAKDIHVTHLESDKPYLHIHVDVLEDITNVNDADFTPPANAVAPPSTPRVVVSANQMQDRLIEHKEISKLYLTNLEPGEDSHVTVAFVVGADGRVLNVRPVSGSRRLQELVVKAVKQWTYRSLQVNNQSVEVETEVSENFTTQ